MTNILETAGPQTSDPLIWDIETNGLMPDVDTLWCTGVRKGNQAELLRTLEDTVDTLENAEEWAGHNLLGYDIPVLEHLLGEPLVKPKNIWDTLIISRVLYPNIADDPISKGLPRDLKWSHSLKAWGYRLGDKKQDYDGGWDEYTEEMGDYCLQDTSVTAKLYQHLQTRAQNLGIAWDAHSLTSPIGIEQTFKQLIMRQEATGFYFNQAAAEKLVSPLVGEREEILKELREVFPTYTETVHYVTPKRQEHKTKEVVHEFNPSSRQQVGERLMEAGWEPGAFTKTGQPVVNETTMAEAAEAIPQAKLIDRLFTIDKRLGAIANGDNAWLRLVRNGKIHGRVNTLGAVTTRVTHNSPNMSQVPSVDSYLGPECRALFHARPGWSLVGADLSGIELRCLAHYLTYWDEGEYIDHVLNGDVHTVHQKAFGLPDGKKWRGVGKGGTYCLIYGGGDWKLGFTLGARGSEAVVAKHGKIFRNNLMDSLPALKNLTDAVKQRRKQGSPAGKHHIRGIAGHPLYCRAEHSAINTLLQSAGATIAKVWYCTFHQTMEELGYVYGEDYETHGFFHDEIQVGCRPELADVVGSILCESAVKAGETLGVRLPVEAEYSTGFTWADTH